jgi:tetratricopeptide (TPR) repeat protein
MIELDGRSIRKRLEATLREHGEEHPEAALCYLDLGDKYELEGKFALAERDYLKASEIFAKLGLDHELLLAIALKSAAEMARMQDKIEIAAALKARARALVKTFCRRDFGVPDGDGDGTAA